MKGILHSPLSVRLSVMLSSPPKSLDEIHANLVCEFLTWMGDETTFFGPAPRGPWEGQKVKYHLISVTKSISQIFIPNFVCVLTNERYKTYAMGFSFCRLGHAPGVWQLGPRGVWGVNFFQTWSCGISHRRGWQAEQNARRIFILESNWWPWVRSKGQISLNFGYHITFKDFYTKLCFCSHK